MQAVAHAETGGHAEVSIPRSFEFDDDVILADTVRGPSEDQRQLLAQLFGAPGNVLFELHGS